MIIKNDGDIKTVETNIFILDRYLDFNRFILTDTRTGNELKSMGREDVEELYNALSELLKD